MSYQNESGATADPWEVVKRGQENTERMVERFTAGFDKTNETITQLSKELANVAKTLEVVTTKVESDLESEREAKKRLYKVIDELKQEQARLIAELNAKIDDLENEIDGCKEKMHDFMLEFERYKGKVELATGTNKLQIGAIITVALLLLGAGVNALFKFFAGGGA